MDTKGNIENKEWPVLTFAIRETEIGLKVEFYIKGMCFTNSK